MTRGQAWVSIVTQLARGGEHSLGGLSLRTGVHPGTVAQIVLDLEEAGAVVRIDNDGFPLWCWVTPEERAQAQLDQAGAGGL